MRESPTTMTEFLMLYHFFFSPQVKRSVIIIDRHGIHELPSRVAKRLKT